MILPQPFQKGGVRGDSQGMIALIEHHARAGAVGLPDMGTGAVIDIHFSGIFAIQDHLYQSDFDRLVASTEQKN